MKKENFPIYLIIFCIMGALMCSVIIRILEAYEIEEDNRIHFPIGDTCIAIGNEDDYERHVIENCDCAVHQKKDSIMEQKEGDTIIEFDRTYKRKNININSTWGFGMEIEKILIPFDKEHAGMVFLTDGFTTQSLEDLFYHQHPVIPNDLKNCNHSFILIYQDDNISVEHCLYCVQSKSTGDDKSGIIVFEKIQTYRKNRPDLKYLFEKVQCECVWLLVRLCDKCKGTDSSK